MANPQGRSSRHVSRQSSVASHLGENIFSDENEIDVPGIADGYQPSFTLQDVPSRSRRSSYQTSTFQNRTSPAREPKKKAPVTQEVSQPLISRNSFSLQHDAQYSDPPRRIASVSSSADRPEASTIRPQSTLSRNSTFARPQSTYNGPSAPSHPYGMYPQNPTEPARRVSVASSHRPTRERSFMGAHRPTHPYGMYPQDTVFDNNTDTLTASADIASVGFPGLGRQQFARRLDPNGDDADDIIGPDGHTEQLPPYTEHPAAGVYKPRTLTSVPLSPIPQEPSQTANSAHSINDTLLSPITPTSMRDPILQPHRHSALRTRERLGQRSRQKTCFGKMPLWMVILVILLLVILGAVAGGIIGRFVLHGRNKDPSANSPYPASSPETTPGSSSPSTSQNSSDYNPITDLPAARPLPTPALGPLSVPTGLYPIAVSSSPDKSTACLNNTQRRAWDCARSMNLNINVANPLNGPAMVTLSSLSGSVNVSNYGDQTPSTIEGPVFGSLVIDPDETGYGPAYYFNTTYNKQVVIHADDFASASKSSVMQQFERRQQRQDRNAPIGNNEQVWDCWWNETYVDGFIYIDEPASTMSAPNPMPTGNSKRHLSKIFAGKTAISPYTKKVKIREYRQQPAAPAQCTRMQFVNGAMVPSTQAPTTISLIETDPPGMPFTVAKLMLSQDWSKRKHKHKYGSKVGDKDQSQGNAESDFCACVWDFD